MNVETQEASSKMARNLLKQSAEAGDWVRIFTTGFAPVVVGIMSAVEQLLYQSRCGDLQTFVVETMVLEESYYSLRSVGDDITQDSPGALEEHYRSLGIWY
jgi:hypothetical protein